MLGSVRLNAAAGTVAYELFCALAARVIDRAKSAWSRVGAGARSTGARILDITTHRCGVCPVGTGCGRRRPAEKRTYTIGKHNQPRRRCIVTKITFFRLCFVARFSESLFSSKHVARFGESCPGQRLRGVRFGESRHAHHWLEGGIMALL